MGTQSEDSTEQPQAKAPKGLWATIVESIGSFLSMILGIGNANASTEKGDKPGVKQELPPPPPKTEAPPAAATDRKPLVVFDLGHGVIMKKGHRHTGAGHDGDYGGVKEAVVVESIGKKAKAILEKMGMKVILSRGKDLHDDKDQLASRPEVANEVGADMFVSIHANASATNAKAKGAEIYAHRDGSAASKQLAIVLAEAMQGKALTAGFAVLKEDAQKGRPAVLVETDYLSNEDSRKMLASEEGQNSIAQRLARGIGEFMKTQNVAVAKGSNNTVLASATGTQTAKTILIP